MLSKKDVLKMSDEELYNYLLPTIKDLYEQYKKEYDFDQFNLLSLNAMDEAKTTITDNGDFDKLFKSRLTTSLTSSPVLSGTDSLNDYLREISVYPLLSAEEEKDLFEKYKNGDMDAKEKIVNSNLRLVVHIAKMYLNKGLTLDDLVQDGNLGLMKAVEMFDQEKGFRFSTYAFWWIKQAVTRAICDKGREIRLPVHVVESITKYKKAVKKLTDKLHRNPTYEEIAEEMNLPLQKVMYLHKHQYELVSLSAPVGQEKDSELGYFIPSDEDGPEEETFKRLLPEEMKEVLDNSKLTDRELFVIRYRFGFVDNKEHTLEDTGKILHVTRERVRQIEAKSLRRLSKLRAMQKMAWWVKEDGNSSHTPEYYNIPRRPKEDSLYQLLFRYKKEEIDYAFTRLRPDEKELVEARFGKDLKTPNINELTKAETSRLFRVIIPKMEKILYSITKSKNYSNQEIANPSILTQKKMVLCNYLENGSSPNTIDFSKKGLNDLELGYVIGVLKVKLESTDNNYKREAYLQLMNFLYSNEFGEMLDSLSVREAVLVVLKTGLVNDKYYSNEDLCSLLGIDEYQLNDLIKKVLIVYRNKLTNKEKENNKTLIR